MMKNRITISFLLISLLGLYIPSATAENSFENWKKKDDTSFIDFTLGGTKKKKTTEPAKEKTTEEIDQRAPNPKPEAPRPEAPPAATPVKPPAPTTLPTPTKAPEKPLAKDTVKKTRPTEQLAPKQADANSWAYIRAVTEDKISNLKKELVDTDKDGKSELTLVDVNGDGKFEGAAYDSDKNGHIDVMVYDIDQDGTVEYIDMFQSMNVESFEIFAAALSKSKWGELKFSDKALQWMKDPKGTYDPYK